MSTNSLITIDIRPEQGIYDDWDNESGFSSGSSLGSLDAAMLFQIDSFCAATTPTGGPAPVKKKLLNLIFDLDATMVHCSQNLLHVYPESDLNCSVHTIVLDENDVKSTWYIKVRPYIVSCLETLGEYFNIYVYTHGLKQYALRICDLIHSGIEPLLLPKHILAREDQQQAHRQDPTTTELYRKSLFAMNAFLQQNQITLGNTLIFDDRLEVWESVDQCNVIPVPPFEATHDIIDNVFMQFTKQLMQLVLDKTISQDTVVVRFLEQRKRLLSGCKICLVNFESTGQYNPMYPFFSTLDDFKFVLQHCLGAAEVVTTIPSPDTTHIIWIQSNPEIKYPIQYLQKNKNVLPHIVHWSWLLQIIYFSQMPSEISSFSTSKEFHAFCLFSTQHQSEQLHKFLALQPCDGLPLYHYHKQCINAPNIVTLHLVMQ
jgi:hypothetical protein